MYTIWLSNKKNIFYCTLLSRGLKFYIGSGNFFGVFSGFFPSFEKKNSQSQFFFFKDCSFQIGTHKHGDNLLP